MEQLYLIGAGGQARSVISLLKACNIKVVGIYDESFNKNNIEIINSVKLIGDIESYNYTGKIVLAVGDNIKRRELFLLYRKNVLKKTICHPTSFIDNTVILGVSNLFFANTFSNSNVIFGDNNIINTGAIIEHEVVIGSHNHISVGAIICGRATLGSNCFIGAGAVVVDKIEICSDVTIGANAVVVKSIKEPGVYVGNPVKKIA
ncbi:NeuD/PglB/VioB family sugar acetyltransferase [Aequorivita vladivostokensis]|uniref:NeuD/PglB/VioB family sugar acetyltransferase n=1 Tax=Aequorivita vladivostokensis TaxID=171194 RepID=UPI0013F3DEDC|nr:NeuD/PglB/VioB family sugar acetyltransferase [Aequorivita vladivostokensis]